MKLYRLCNTSIDINNVTEVRQIEVKATKNGQYVTRQNTRINALDVPHITIKIVTYSNYGNPERMKRLCAKIRKAVEEYEGWIYE